MGRWGVELCEEWSLGGGPEKGHQARVISPPHARGEAPDRTQVARNQEGGCPRDVDAATKPGLRLEEKNCKSRAPANNVISGRWPDPGTAPAALRMTSSMQRAPGVAGRRRSQSEIDIGRRLLKRP